MKSASLKSRNQTSYLKLVKSNAKIEEIAVTRIYINTLIPGFSYKNNLGEIITPKKCILL